MENEVLQTVGQIAGIGGLAIGVLLLVFRQIIAKSIFPKLKQDHAYSLLRLISVLVFVVAIAGIGAWTLLGSAQNSTVEAAGDNEHRNAQVRAEDGSVAAGGDMDGNTITIQQSDPPERAANGDRDAPNE